MPNLELGINPRLVKIEITKALKATKTRIGRCISVKRIAIGKIRDYNQRDADYGFKHLNAIVKIQLVSYQRYGSQINSSFSTLLNLRQQIASADTLELGFFARRGFNISKERLLVCMQEAEQQILYAEEMIRGISALINSQLHFLNIYNQRKMTADEEAILAKEVTQEIRQSELFMAKLDECKEKIFYVIQMMVPLQARIVMSFKKIGRKGKIIVDSAEQIGGKLVKALWLFYAFKSYLLLGVVVLMGFSSLPLIEETARAMFAGIVSVDGVTDWLVGLPGTIILAQTGSGFLKRKINETKLNIQSISAKGNLMFNGYLKYVIENAKRMPLINIKI